MSKIYNIKRSKPKENQLGILKIYSLLGNSVEGLGPGLSTAGVTYLSLRTHWKRYYIFCLKVARSFFSGSGKGTVGA